MSRHEATFEFDSKSDARAARALVERAYDVLREETREVAGDDSGQSEMLEEFETLRDAAGHLRPGTLTVRLDQRDEEFER